MGDPTEIQRYQLLKKKIEQLARDMGLNMEHCSILLETEDPKLALVFTVQPEAFATSEERNYDEIFSDMIANMDGDPKEDEANQIGLTDTVKQQIQDFLKGKEDG